MDVLTERLADLNENWKLEADNDLDGVDFFVIMSSGVRKTEI